MAEARAAFQRDFSNDIATATAYALSKRAKPVLKDLVNKFQDPAQADKLARVVAEVEQVKQVMQQNIQSALKVSTHHYHKGCKTIPANFFGFDKFFANSSSDVSLIG